jgi:hypothetical protein
MFVLKQKYASSTKSLGIHICASSYKLLKYSLFIQKS